MPIIDKVDPSSASGGPLFIVGCGRSGTTLLRLMLNMHPDICIPEESHVIYQIARLRSFGLWPAAGSPEFSDYFLKYVESSKFMDNWELPPNALRKRVMESGKTDFGSLLESMYEEFRVKEGKPLWGDKTPMHVQYMWIVRYFFPTARFIHIIRDARDVAQSVAAKSWGPRHISHAGYYWKWLVLSGMINGRMMGSKNYYEVRFEDLVSNPESTLREITAFAGLKYSNMLLKYHEGSAAFDYAAKGNEGSKRLQQVLDPKRIYLWRESMPPSQIKSVDRQAGAVLRLLGYESFDSSRRQTSELEKLRHLMTENELLKLDQQATAYQGGKFATQIGMHWQRLSQARCFATGNWFGWAKAGIRWQRTVARLLG